MFTPAPLHMDRDTYLRTPFVAIRVGVPEPFSLRPLDSSAPRVIVVVLLAPDLVPGIVIPCVRCEMLRVGSKILLPAILLLSLLLLLLLLQQLLLLPLVLLPPMLPALLFFVSARTNKRHHLLLPLPILLPAIMLLPIWLLLLSNDGNPLETVAGAVS